MRPLFLVALLPLALAQFCARDEIPDKIAVNQDGEVALGCRFNECPKDFNDAAAKTGASPKCGNRYYELSCDGPLQWVGGIPRGSNLNNVVPLQCCTAQKLRDSPQGEETKIVEPGQVYEGQVHYDKYGNIAAYDIIKNAQRISVGEDRFGLSVTVSRLNCQAKRAASIGGFESADVGGELHEAGVAADADGAFQGPFGDLGGGLAGLGGGAPLGGPLGGAGLGGDFGGLDGGLGLDPFAAAAPLPPAPLPAALPAALPAFGAAGGACFDGETTVETPAGPKKMADVRIGDELLSVSGGKIVGFSPVRSFLHRLPEKKYNFQRIQGADGSVVTLTDRHFIFTTPCDMVAPTKKWAKDVIPGAECLLRVEGESQVPERILSNSVIESVGVYNPMTEAGTVVTGGVVSSCHNVVDDDSFMSTLTSSVVKLQKMLSFEENEDNIELPWALQFAIDYASKVL